MKQHFEAAQALDHKRGKQIREALRWPQLTVCTEISAGSTGCGNWERHLRSKDSWSPRERRGLHRDRARETCRWFPRAFCCVLIRTGVGGRYPRLREKTPARSAGNDAWSSHRTRHGGESCPSQGIWFSED